MKRLTLLVAVLALVAGGAYAQCDYLAIALNHTYDWEGIDDVLPDFIQGEVTIVGTVEVGGSVLVSAPCGSFHDMAQLVNFDCTPTEEPWRTWDFDTCQDIEFPGDLLNPGGETTLTEDHFGLWAFWANGENYLFVLEPGGGAQEPEACVQVSPSPPVVDEEVTVWLFVDGETTPIGPSFEPMCIWDGDEICLGEGLVGDGSLVFTWTQAMQDLVADPYATVGIWADLCAPDPPWECDPGALAEMPISEFVAGGGDACADLEPVPYVPPPPPQTEGAPVAGMLGLGLVAAACALGGAMTLRKK